MERTLTKTITATVTKQQVEQAEREFKAYESHMDEFDRFIGTIESYGAYPTTRPNWSNPENAKRALERIGDK